MPATTSLRRVTTRGQQQQDRLLLRPLDDDDFVWPNLDTIAAAQRKFGDKAELSRLEEGDDGVRRTDSRLWIPAEATNCSAACASLHIATPRATVAGTRCWHTSAASSTCPTFGNAWTGFWRAASCATM
ncbi:hypothetical protein PR002_g31698 [Phytophthora rubi]|uniref:Uncharacterized protein n=1 Tax=Phytophthora rubi TaxID=129364 RepID=A0A6A3GH23_9STRA|nr:hypothetical protein PR002_g31698 [Phytophthora rubi]